MPFAEELKVAIIGDASKLKGALSEAEIGINRFSEKVFSTGKNMTLIGTAITAVSVGLIKMASDAEETATKFDVVFKDVSDQAAKTAKNLSDNFGLSQKAAKQLLSDTGDLLTGFGFTGQAALDLSTKVNELAVDLASFTNYSGGAEGASAALTKALLGERESVKALGISILETDVQAKVLLLTQQGMVFETDRQAKAYATLMIAQEQSKNAIGDFSRTSEGFANQMRILKGRIADTAVALGEHLLPMATKVVGKVIEVVTKINEWIDAHPKLTGAIVKVGAILGAFALIGGPVLMAAAAFMKAKSVIDGMTFALNLLNIKIGATGAITTGTLIPSLTNVATKFGILGAPVVGPIAIAGFAIVGLYAAWKTNLFGMRDITREAIADINRNIINIKGNFTNLSDFLKSGGGGGAGAFFDEKPILPEINPDTSNDDFQKQMEEDAKAAEDMAARVKEATESLVNIMQPTYDKLYEMSHTAEESAVRNLTAQKDAAIEAVKALELATDEQAGAIATITQLYNDEVDLIIAKIEEEKEAKRLEIETTVVGELAKMKAIREGLKPYDELIAKVNAVATATEESAARQVRALRTVTDVAGNTTLTNLAPQQSAGSYEEAQAIVAANVKSYDVGTPSVPKTGLALIHKGEEINLPGKRSYDQSKSYSPTVNITVQGDGDANKIKSIVEQTLNDMARQYSRTGYEMAY